jgi:pimeloyl-ACP methyl ester carboxylesterase
MNGEWVREPTKDSDMSIVFVHGILSSGTQCWLNENGTHWPTLLAADPESGNFGIYIFTYRSDLYSKNYRLGDAAGSLRDNLRLDKVLDRSRRLVFVCHSMGGILVRYFLVTDQVDLIDAKKEIGLFLVASPSLGANYANLLEFGARLIGNTQARALRFAQDNDWLNDLDNNFVRLKDRGKLRIVGTELIEDQSIFLPRLWGRQVVEPFSGARYFSDPHKIPYSDHMSIAKPDGLSAMQHRLLREFITEFSHIDAHEYALNISINCDHDSFSIWVTNRGTHVIRDIEINTIPDDDDWHEGTHGFLPKMHPIYTRGVEIFYPILGGWFHAKVEQLNPNRGLMIARFQIGRRDYTKIDIDAFWNDHAGMQRKSHVVVDVASVTGDLSLRPRR